jgi:bifunctional ADP-heptose synthase (sugar kinase/adenylyltransferase)
MDTRGKIVGTAEAARLLASGATLVSGYFDPLIAAHAGRLTEFKRDGVPLVVAIASSDDSILPARARAELVAGLRAVDYVVESDRGLTPHMRLEQEDVARLQKLIEHVHARQQAAS